MARAMSGREARYGSLAVASILVVLAILVAINYLSARHNKRWDLTAAKQFTLSEQTRKVLQSLQKPVAHQSLRHVGRIWPFPRAARRVHVRVAAGVRRVHRRRRAAVTRQSVQGRSAGHGRHRIRRARRAGRVGQRAGADERAHQSHPGTAAQGVLRPGARRARSSTYRIGPATAPSRRRSARTTTRSRSWCWRSRRRCPADASVLIVAGPKTDFFPPEIEMVKKLPETRGQDAFPARSAGPRRLAAADRAHRALLNDWGIEIGANVVVDVSGMGQLFGTGAEVPVAAKYNPHAITENFRLITAYPLARSVGSRHRQSERPASRRPWSRPARAAGPRQTSRS